MIFGNSEMRGRFILWKTHKEGAYGQEKASYRTRLEKGLIISLSLMILMFLASRRIPQKPKKVWTLSSLTTVALDVTPRTTHGGMPRPPTLPQVPILTEDEYLPEDETIELTQLNVSEDIPLFDGFGSGGGGTYLGPARPRPIKEVIPEYPDSERKQGIEGVVVLEILVNEWGKVDSVRVVHNNTQSRRLERSAIEAAYKSKYMPATRDGRKVPIWIQRPYRFEGK